MTRLPFLVLAITLLVIGVLTGLARTGVPIPESMSMLTGLHSIFMLSGFFGTVIGLERAVATRKPWAYVAPISSALGGLAILTSLPESLSPGLFTLAGIIFVAANIRVSLIQPAIYSITLLAGALLWLIGNIGWLIFGNPWISIAYGLSFLVLTIAGERLELTRFLPPRKYATGAFAMIGSIILAGTFVSGTTNFADTSLLGAGYALLSFWLLLLDIARKTVHKSGITRFVAICLLSGYLWLLAGGLLMTNLFDIGGLQRDIAIHAIALGFIFAMVIGHAPIIFPAVLQVAIPFSTVLYIPLSLVDLGLAFRLAAAILSDLAIRQIAAIINALGILTFFLCLALQVIRGLRRQRQRS